MYFSNDGGRKWIQLKAGVPTIAVRDVALQYRDDALVLGTFGRGFYILDDYTALRTLKQDVLNKDVHLFDIPNSLVYVEATDRGIRASGSTFYAAPNPPFGVTFTYYVKEGHTSLKAKRRKEEKKLRKENRTPPYPTYEQLKAEDTEEKPYLIFTIRDSDNEVIRKLTAPKKKGVQRLTWDLKYPSLSPVTNEKGNKGSWLLVMQGEYSVEISLYEDGKVKQLIPPKKFTVETLKNSTLPARDREGMDNFVRKIARLQRALYGTSKLADETKKRLNIIKAALDGTPGDVANLKQQRAALHTKLDDMVRKLQGDPTLSKRHENQPPSIMGRVQLMAYQLYQTTSEPTAEHQEAYRIVSEKFVPILNNLRTMVESEIPAIEAEMERQNAPWTPGRVPQWQPE